MPQHLNSLAYYGEYLRGILYTLFVEHKCTMPMWDMHIGYGSDILTTLALLCNRRSADVAVCVW